jgi:hypothetical protein
MKTQNRNITGYLFLFMMLLFMSCEREGPMGPEGPQGPDGPPGEDAGGGSGSSVTTFITSPGANIRWEISDGWGGYGVYELKGAFLSIPESYKKAIEEGLAVVYMGGPEDDWYKLPWTWGQQKNQIYDCVIKGTTIEIYAKIKDEPNGEENEPVSINKIKIVIAPASKVYTLSLTN